MTTAASDAVPFFEAETAAGPEPEAPGRVGSVSDFVLAEIANRIVDGTYRPGQRIIEADVTRDLGVSRSSVREAFRRLEINRFIRIEPNRGATVATPRVEEITAQFRIREVVAGLGARAAAERVHEPGHREIVLGLLADIEAQRGRDTPRAHRAENGRFHRAINTMSGIPDIGNLLEQYNYPILHTIYFRDLTLEFWESNLSDHLDIARAILHADPVAAEHFARRHMIRTVPVAIEIATRLLAEE